MKGTECNILIFNIFSLIMNVGVFQGCNGGLKLKINYNVLNEVSRQKVNRNIVYQNNMIKDLFRHHAKALCQEFCLVLGGILIDI